jgi:DNA-binding NtrC family response regulator
MPVKTFLTPTPQEIQDRFLADFNTEIKKEFACFYEIDFTSADNPADIHWHGAGSTEMTGQGMLWKNESDSLSFLVVQRRIDLYESDFSIKVNCEIRQDHGPAFLVSPVRLVRTEPERMGYLAGRHGGFKKYLLKRDGHILKCLPVCPDRLKAPAEYRFSKMGQSFFLHYNEDLVLGYYDRDVTADPENYLVLALRPGCSVLLNDIQIETRTSSDTVRPDVPENYIVKLKPSGKDYFILNRFYNLSMSANFHEVSGYILQNVTDIQNKMDRLTQDYENQLRRGNKLENLLKSFQAEHEKFVGTSPPMQQLKQRARIVADSDATVLIQGATGTGKEVMANFIHANSPFRNGPFVKVDCSTLPRELMESELFGHEKGSFTGAIQQKTGLFEQANHGTLFLDEVGNLTLEMQAKLLQFLQDFKIQRVGSTQPIPLQLRVVAATNVNLETLVNSGNFREDLYYRLFVVVMKIPSLKDRIDDLPALCSHFLALFGRSGKKRIKGIASPAFKKIYAYHWPGNIRELKNVIQRAVLFCEGNEISEELIILNPAGEERPAVQAPSDPVQVNGGFSRYPRLHYMPDDMFERVLGKYRGNIAKISKEIGVSRRALYYHLKKKGLDIHKYRSM